MRLLPCNHQHERDPAPAPRNIDGAVDVPGPLCDGRMSELGGSFATASHPPSPSQLDGTAGRGVTLNSTSRLPGRGLSSKDTQNVRGTQQDISSECQAEEPSHDKRSAADLQPNTPG